jgi:Tol biopolymer transport system component
MSLAAGTRLGPYEIVALLGAGGMGEVYKARDPRLGRDVAIKVLPPEFAADPDRLHRFEQEARAASALNHPNILVVHDIGSHDGAPYLVSELLEGESLRARLQSGPLPPRRVVELAVQVCAGLAAAHEKGIVHRDLKPENLFITADGHVKILDFGLAKLRAQPLPEGTAAPTVADTTQPGIVIGTVAYMSPEQVRGQPVDHRSDLFSLGCVLYEMLTGQRAFARGTAADTMSAILKEEPPEVTTLQPSVPPPLAHVVGHCLEKQPGDRFQSARDLAFDLESMTATGATPPPAVLGKAGARRRLRAWVVAGIALAAVALAAGFFLVGRLSVRSPTRPGVMRFSVTAPADGTVVTDPASAAISPDGSRLVVTLTDSTGIPRLWIRPLDHLEAQLLPGTENAICPFWSPDSRFIAFFAEGKLRRVPVAGGAAEVICDAPDARGGAWSKDGVIVFAPKIVGSLFRVSANGGEVVEVARPDRALHETGLRWPYFLPDGKHFVYVGLPKRQGGFEVYLAALDSKEHRRMMTAGSAPVYADPGYLLFASGDRLVAQQFDAARLQPVGEIVPLGDVAPVSVFDGAPALSASANGVLAHATTIPPNTQLVWLDRAGHPTGTVPVAPGGYASVALSPDGRWAAVTKASSSSRYDLWTVDLERGVPTRLTFEGSAGVGYGGANANPIWSRDSSRIAFQYNPSGPYDIYQTLANGTGRPEPLVQSSVILKSPAAFTPDGKYLVFSQAGETTGWDLWLLPLTGDRTPVPYLRTPFAETTAAISPDGRWLAYDSDETGAPEIYVQSFPVPGERHRVSARGGISAQWSKDGRELLVWSSSQAYYGFGPVFSVDVQTTPTFKTTSAPRVLFTPRQDVTGLAAAADLKRFLAAVPVEGASPASIVVMLNWQAALKAR